MSLGKQIKIVRTYNFLDLILLRSLLHSCGIPSLVHFMNHKRLFPGVHIKEYTDVILVVHENNYATASEIITDYIDQTGITKVKNRIPRRLVHIIEVFVLGGYAIPDSNEQTLPEILPVQNPPGA